MTARGRTLALFGGAPAFDAPRHVGQLNLPPRDAFDEAFQGIFQRDWYANHGPLAQQLDDELARFFGVRHAIAMVNGATALMVLTRALQVRGEVLTTAFTFPATAQSITWAGLTPRFCDVDPETHNLSADTVEPHIGPDTGAIMGVHLWGRACDPEAMEELARRRGLRLIFDAAHATGCTYKGRRIGGFGDAEMFSFHATKVLNGAEGGCISTNDDALAARLRTMRSFHEGETFVDGAVRFNAKVSEAQAAMALLGLRGVEGAFADNLRRYELYRQGVAAAPGVSFVDYALGERSNRQYILLSVDTSRLNRDRLLEALHAENILARRYFWPGLHRLPPYSEAPDIAPLPITDQLCHQLFQLPTGQGVSDADVELICEVVVAAARALVDPRQVGETAP